jgi:hypothetical protein
VRESFDRALAVSILDVGVQLESVERDQIVK